MAKDILTIGDASVDIFMKVDHATIHCDVNHESCELCFKYGEKIPVDELSLVAAGNAVNVAVGTSRLGLSAEIYTELGDDSNGALVIEQLEDNKIATEHCYTNAGKKTNIHPIAVFKGERTIFSYHDNFEYKMRDFEIPKILYYTSISKGFEDFQKELLEFVGKNKEMIFIMNPGTAQLHTNISAIREVLTNLDILLVNKEEAEKLTEVKDDLEKIHKKLFDDGVKLSVITDSKNGSTAYDGKKLYKLGVHDLGEKVDATGAGDAYASGFISAIFYGKNIEEAMKWGTFNAAAEITEIGANNGTLEKSKMEELVKDVKIFS